MSGQIGDVRGGTYDVAYLILSGTTTAARCPEIAKGLVDLGFKTVIAIPSTWLLLAISGRKTVKTLGDGIVRAA